MRPYVSTKELCFLPERGCTVPRRGYILCTIYCFFLPLCHSQALSRALSLSLSLSLYFSLSHSLSLSLFSLTPITSKNPRDRDACATQRQIAASRSQAARHGSRSSQNIHLRTCPLYHDHRRGQQIQVRALVCIQRLACTCKLCPSRARMGRCSSAASGRQTEAYQSKGESITKFVLKCVHI